MRFLVLWQFMDSVTQETTRYMRQTFGEGMATVLQSPRVQDAGIYADAGGGYLVVNVETPEDLLAILGPEIIDNCRVESHPIVSTEAAGALYRQWAEQGR